jgi:hypothetical protein
LRLVFCSTLEISQQDGMPLGERDRLLTLSAAAFQLRNVTSLEGSGYEMRSPKAG